MGEQKKEDHFSNESVEVECRYRPGCVIEADVTISPEATKANFENAIKETRKQASLPGFRKGKIPRETLFKHFKSQIEAQAKETLISLGFKEAVTLIGRHPFSKQSVSKSTIKKYDLENGADLYFEYEAVPKVPEVDPETLSIEMVEPVPPSEEEISEYYKRLQLMFAKKTEISDRAAKEGDSVSLIIMRPEDPDAQEQKGQFYLIDKMVPEWLLNGVIGMETGSIKEMEIPSTDDTQPSVQVQVTLSKLEECALPEDDDEFAKKAGAETIAQLREKIIHNLEDKARAAAQERMRRQVKKELIRLYAFDLPQSLVERETQARFLPYWESASKDPNCPLDKETTRKSFLDSVKRQFTCFFLLQPVFSKLNIPHSQQELMEELNHQLNDVPATQCVLYPNLEEKEVVDRLLANIIVRHCVDHYIELRLGIKAPGKALEAPEEKASEGRHLP